MSAVAHRPGYAPSRPVAPSISASRPTLRRVEREPRADAPAMSRGRVTAIMLVALVSIYLLRQLVSVGVDAGAYEIAALNQAQINLSRDAEFMTEQLNVLDSPQNLATMAEKMGMISNAKPAYLRLSDSKVFGSPSGARGTAGVAVPIANDLIAQLGVTPVVSGVATSEKPAVTEQSTVDAGTVASTADIPAPQTN